MSNELKERVEKLISTIKTTEEPAARITLLMNLPSMAGVTENTIDCANLCRVAALLCIEWGYFIESTSLLQKARYIFDNIHQARNIYSIECLNMESLALFQTKFLREAFICADEALVSAIYLASQTDLKDSGKLSIASLHGNKAKVLAAMGKWADAQKELKAAHKLLDETQDEEGAREIRLALETIKEIEMSNTCACPKCGKFTFTETKVFTEVPNSPSKPTGNFKCTACGHQETPGQMNG